MRVRVGIDVLLSDQRDLIAGRRIGLVGSPSSVDADLRPSVDRLAAASASGVELAALFGPEHGLRGAAQAGDHVSTTTDPETGVPIYSLYGDTQRPTADMLDGLDALVFDLQDGGMRFYTYHGTLLYCMKAAADHGVQMIVLDRPNPINGVTVEGPMLQPGYESFVGVYPVPIRHGMTAGEMALMCNDRFGIGCDLRVVSMDGWRRSMWFDQTGLDFVPPSPNLPTLSSMTVYPGTCLFEGTTVSEGRGTTRPFEYIGAPWIDAELLARSMNALDLPGVRFRPVYFTPMFSKHKGELCGGVHIVVRNEDRDRFRALPTALHLLAQIKATCPDQTDWRAPWADGGHRPIDLLAGGSSLREQMDASRPVAAIVASWEADLAEYDRTRRDYFLYGA